MITASQAIADLDAALARAGSPIVVRRYTAPTGTPRPKTDITVNATVRAAKAEELVGDIDQLQSTVVLSPTGMSSLLPLRKGDKVVWAGGERNIERAGPVYIQGTLVRIDLLVTG